MTEKEEQEFLDIVNTTSFEAKGKGENNLYNILGLIPFSDYNINNYNIRKEYIGREFKNKPDDLNKARKLINMANPILSHPTKKDNYDTELKHILEKKLIKYIEFAVLKDKILDNDEREQIEETGDSFGFKKSEIHIIIEEQRKKHHFKDSSGTKEIETASKTTKAGSPKLEIHNNTNFLKNGEFLFDNVKLTETRREVITIKNGGGGTLDATAIYSAKWIDVIPKKIHQSKLPQDVTIIIDPSKDKTLKNGSAIMDTINLSYASVGGTLRLPIVIKMAIEGHHGLVKRQTKYSTIVSSILAGLMLLYIFLNYDFSGWTIFGFVVSAIAIGIGSFAAIENEENAGGFLIIGGIILLITNWLIFVLVLTVIITFYASKFIFEKNPFRNELIAAIPIGSFIVFLAFFFGTNNLNTSNYNYNNNNYKNSNTQQNTYHPTISINRTAYIKADPIGNIRSGTSTNTSILTSLNKGTQVYIIEQDKATDWYKVRYGNNNIGYVSDVVISFDYISKNNNNQITKPVNNNTTTSNYITTSSFIGNWRINNENSKYKFSSNYTGIYTNSRGRTTNFRWSLTNKTLKIILDSDNSVWNWEINSFSNNNISMYSSKNKINRNMSKI